MLKFLRPGVSFAWHRRLGLVFGFALLLWTLSGVLHPIISRLGPNARLPKSDVINEMALTPPAQLSCLQGVKQINAARLSVWQQRLVWQFAIKAGQPRLFCDAKTGELIPNAESVYAQSIAQAAMGENARINTIERITAFGPRYPDINRILPVYQARFEDGTSLTIDPATGQLAANSNVAKTWGSILFRQLHTWAVLPQGAVQKTLVSLALAGLFLGAVFGWRWVLRIWPSLSNRPRYVRLHAYLGIALSIPLFAWLISGIWHTWRPDIEITANGPAAWIEVSQLKQLPMIHGVSEVVLLPYGQGYWRLAGPSKASGEHDHHKGMTQKSALNYVVLTSGENITATVVEQQLAQTLAAVYAPRDKIKNVSVVTRFDGEYGFIFKRLPVLKVDLTDAEKTSLYLDPVNGALAAKINSSARLEGYVFATLHKGHWLDDLVGKNIRDTLLAIVAGFLFVLGVLGLVRGLRKRCSPKA